MKYFLRANAADRADHWKRDQIGSGRVAATTLIVTGESMQSPDDGKQAWVVWLHDPAAGDDVDRLQRFRGDARVGNAISAYRFGPGDYFIPPFDATQDPFLKWFYLSLALGVPAILLFPAFKKGSIPVTPKL